MKSISFNIGLIFTLLIVGVRVCYSAQVEIQLKQDVSLTGSKYTLSDIANIYSVSKSTVKRFSRIEIGRSPRPNYIGHVSRNSIESRIESVFPGASQEIIWLGENIVQVKSIGVDFSGQRLTSVAEIFVTQWLSQQYDDFQVHAIKPTKNLLLPPGKIEIRPKLVEGNRLNKRMSVWLDIYVDELLFRTLPIWLSVSVFKEALVAKNTIDKHEVLNPESFHAHYLDISKAGGEIVENIGDISGVRTIKSLSAGNILIRDVMQNLPAVIKGQRVSVSASKGNIRLNTSALALNDGELNQYIEVENLNSNQKYSVVVIGPAQTRVD